MSLYEHLKRKKEMEQSIEELGCAGKLELFKDALDVLYKNVETWLSDVISENLIEVSYSDYELDEDYVGKYNVPTMILNALGDRVVIQPVGCNIIGAMARADIKGPYGSAKLVLVPKDATQPRIVTTTYFSEEAYNEAVKKDKEEALKRVKEPIDLNQFAWKQATPAPNVHYIDLTKEVFSKLVESVLNGD